MTKGYIFDLDGTLLDTLSSLAASFNRALAKLGFPTHAVDDYRYFVGDGQRKCVERALPAESCDEDTVRAVMHAQIEDYARTWRDLASPYEGITELLASLEALSLKCSVLTNKDHPFAVKCMAYFFPQAHFDAIQGFSEQIPHKPDPKGALRIAERLGVQLSDMVFVGDTATDIMTARACGMTSVGVLWGFRDAAELNNAGATYIISHPAELLAVTNVAANPLQS